MYLTIKQQVKLSKENEADLRLLCHAAKNLYNEALYAVRQHFFATGRYLNYGIRYSMEKFRHLPNFQTEATRMYLTLSCWKSLMRPRLPSLKLTELRLMRFFR